MGNKIDEITNTLKLNELFHKKEEEEKSKKWIVTTLAVVGIVAVIAGICVAVYKYLSKDEFEDFDDDYYDDIIDDIED